MEARWRVRCVRGVVSLYGDERKGEKWLRYLPVYTFQPPEPLG